MRRIDPQIIYGKPHFGLPFGHYRICSYRDENELDSIKGELIEFITKNLFGEFEIRDVQYIIKPLGMGCDLLKQKQSVGIKYVLWGRAYKVMKLLRRHIVRYKKTRVNGKRKWTKSK